MHEGDQVLQCCSAVMVYPSHAQNVGQCKHLAVAELQKCRCNLWKGSPKGSYKFHSLPFRKGPRKVRHAGQPLSLHSLQAKTLANIRRHSPLGETWVLRGSTCCQAICASSGLRAHPRTRCTGPAAHTSTRSTLHSRGRASKATVAEGLCAVGISTGRAPPPGCWQSYLQLPPAAAQRCRSGKSCRRR